MIERFPKCDTGCALLERDKCVHLGFDFFNRQFQALEIAEQGGCRRKRVCTRGGRFGYFGHVIQLAAGLDNDQRPRSSDMVRDSTFCREASQRCWPALLAASRAGTDVCGLSVCTCAHPSACCATAACKSQQIGARPVDSGRAPVFEEFALGRGGALLGRTAQIDGRKRQGLYRNAKTCSRLRCVPAWRWYRFYKDTEFFSGRPLASG